MKHAVPDFWAPAMAGLEAYRGILAGPGVDRGLLGPREVPRLWERHLANCGVAVDLVPLDSTVIDVGSGAGLPGVVWALLRSDLQVTLIEPLLRRATFLTEALATLEVTVPGLGTRVRVERTRAEDLVGQVAVDVVTARAVAPMDRLLGWTLPLLRPGGMLLALKGASAEQEVEEARDSLAAAGVVSADVVECGAGIVDPATRVVRIVTRGGTHERGHDDRPGLAG